MTVGELAVRTGVPTKTLRYYEEVGLLMPSRNASGWRDYDDTALVVLQLAGVGKRLGLTLAEIAQFVAQFRDPQLSNETLAARLEPQRQRLRAEIRELQTAEALLDALVADCPFRRC